MHRFVFKRPTTVDRPTVMLTEAERREFRLLAHSFGRRRLWARVLAAVPRVRAVHVGWFAWVAGATWIVAWFTTSVPVSSLGFVPFTMGMRRVLWAPATVLRVRLGLHRLAVRLRGG